MIQNAEKFASVDKEKREKVNLKTKAYNIIDEYEKLVENDENFTDELKNTITEVNTEVENLKELVQKDLTVLENDEINQIITKMEQVILKIGEQNTSPNS
jgi:molecular chaperone DnaK (HSP70)